MLEQYLDRILNWHRQRGRRVVGLLQPGLTDLQIVERESPLLLCGDLAELYRWRNGTRVTQDHVLNDHYFTPGYYLLSLEDALDNYFSLAANREWPQGGLPILASGGGDFYGVDQSKQHRVIHHIRGYAGSPVEYPSIAAMMQAVAECYESGAYYLDDRGLFEVDSDAELSITMRFGA